MDLPPCAFSAVVIAVADAFLVAVVVRLSKEGVFGADESGAITSPIPRSLRAPEDDISVQERRKP